VATSPERRRILFDHGAEGNAKETMAGMTRSAIVRMLLDKGADPDPAVAAQAALVRLQAAEQEAATGTHCGVLMVPVGKGTPPVYASLNSLSP
jgi:hypothetical protein